MNNSQQNNNPKVNISMKVTSPTNATTTLAQIATSLNATISKYATTYPTQIPHYGTPHYPEMKVGICEDKNCMKLNKYSIKSITNNNKNALLLIETIKYILIEKNIVTEEEFDKIYNMKEEELKDKINGETVMNELTKYNRSEL